MAAAVPRKILLIDDDEALRSTLGEQLRFNEEFAVVEAATARLGQQRATAEYFDAILLDVRLPDMDGRELCRLLRREGLQVPILLLATGDNEAEQTLGLEAGANDYVVKPFRLNVLLARLRAQLRQHEHGEDAVITIGAFTFKPTDRLLLHAPSGRSVRLTEKEGQILRYLHRAQGRTVSRETLLGEVWGYNAAVTTHTLETHVYRLRQKIEENPSEARLLLTEAGGYRLAP